MSSRHEHDRLECGDLLAQISNYLDGDLEDTICLELESHLAACEDCQIVTDTLGKTISLYRRRGRVVRVSTHLIYGRQKALQQALAASACSRTVNIAFVERYNGTDRHQNARKVRRSYRFSKDWDLHQAATYFSAYSYNFCWPVRTLRQQWADGTWGPPCTPAMSAGLADHVWTLQEWITLPAVERSST